MRVFCASLQTETNTFSPWRAGDADFAEDYSPAGQLGAQLGLYTSVFKPARRECAAEGWPLYEGMCAGAEPGGLVNRGTWERLRGELLGDLRRAGAVDMVVLGLHGAMAADGCLDCEGDLLSRVRDRVGSTCAIGALLDPHCHLTEPMLRAADVLIAFKEYPHMDSFKRAEELWRLTRAAAEGRIRPTPSVYDCRMLTMFFTTVEPSAGLVRMMQETEQQPGVLSVSLAHGFPWGDVPGCGAKVLVYTDDQPEAGEAHAERIGSAVIGARGKTTGVFVPPAKAAELALSWTGERPLVLADTADNVGGGAPGDATWVLRELLRAGVSDAAAAFIFDPVAVQIATAAGEGARIPLRIGGKASSRSGPPLDLEVEVRLLAGDAQHEFGGASLPLGDLAVVRTGGNLDLVLTSLRCQCFHPRAFADFGIDPDRKRVLLVKSMQHFVAGFRPMAGEIVYVDSPGAASLSLDGLAFHHADPQMWPFGAGAAPNRAVSYRRG